jgi:putative transposase
MIERGHDLPVKRQVQLLSISRGSVYYQPRSVSAEDLALMRRIDVLHLDYPFAGRRRHPGGQAARLDANEADGHRGDLPQTQYQQHRATGSISTCCAGLR